MMIVRAAFLLCVALPVFSVVGRAQVDVEGDVVMRPALPRPDYGDRFSWGVFGSVNITSHRTDAGVLPGGLPLENGSNGITSSIGVLGDGPLFRHVALQLRVGYHNYNYRPVTWVSTAVEKPVNGGFEETDGHIRRIAGIRMSSLAVEPLLRFRPTRQLSLSAGGRAGFLLNSTYEYREKVLSPDGGVFTDTRTPDRVVFSGDIPNASSLEVSVVGGISYSLPVNRKQTMFFVPEILYTLALTDIAPDAQWSMSSVRFGVSFVYMNAY